MQLFRCFALTLIMGSFGLMRAQAVVNEGQETVFLWVDGTKGSDLNVGTQLLPLQTIGASATLAVANNKAGIGTHVTINPGIYKESVSLLGGSHSTALPMTFEAATPGTVTLSGAIAYRSWNSYTNNIYTATWPNHWGFCVGDTGSPPYEAPIVLRQEMVYVNGSPMTEVLSLSQMIYPGTFFVDETAGLLYLWPGAGIDPSVADVEVSVLPLLLTINGMNGVVFRNIAFNYASSCHHSPAVVISGNSKNILFDTDQFDWNSGEGIAFNYPTVGISVINSTANHNGADGYQAFQVQNALWQNDSASYNNWRGAQGVYYEWGMGGAHIFSDHSETWTNFTSTYNQTHSMHWDTDDQNISMTNMFSAGNLLGLLIEKNLGPITVSNSTFCGAQLGIAIRDSSNVTLNNNILFDNANAQILLNGVIGGFDVADWATGRPYTTTTFNTTLTNNILVAIGSEQLFKDGYLGGSDWSSFLATLRSSGNVWWNATNGSPFTVPVPTSGSQLNFAGWQGITSQDTFSTFGAPATDPSTVCNSAPVDYPDWWFVLDTLDQSSTAPTSLLTTDAAGKASYTLSNIAIGGWTGTAAIAVDGLQNMPGAAVTFTPPTLTANSTSIANVTTTTATPPGFYELTVLANSGNVTRTLTLDVTVPVTSIMLSTTSLNFPNQPLKITSSPQTVTMTNFGTSAITISGWATTTGFAQTNTCGTSLAAGRNCIISITFKPLQSSPYTGMLTITDSDATKTQVISLSGTSIGSPTILPSVHSLALKGVVYKSTSAPQTVTLTNTGTGVLNVSSVVITGPNASSFAQTNTCVPPVEVNATCAVMVTLTPMSLGSLSGTLTINSNATNTPVTLTLSGSGLTAMKVSPSSVNFGTANVGATGSTHTVTMTNLSTVALGMSPQQLIGASPGDYVLSANTCGSLLAGSSSCTVAVTFVPTAGGFRGGTLSVIDSDPTTPQSVTLIANANAITVSPTSVSFGTVSVGKSIQKTVTVTNASPNPISVYPFQISGTNAADFVTSNDTCKPTLPALMTCTVTITFAPPATGTRSGILTLTDSDFSSPTTIKLSGTGKAAAR